MSDSRSTRPASDVALPSAEDQQPARRLGQRPALDGLRGIAVVYEEWERHGAQSLRRFYARRARRLLPALALLVAFAVLSRLVHTFSATTPSGTLAGSTLLFAAPARSHSKLFHKRAPLWAAHSYSNGRARTLAIHLTYTQGERQSLARPAASARRQLLPAHN